MISALLLAAGLFFGPAASAQQILDLNCVEGLVAVDRAALAGVFSFIAPKDTAPAFADLLVRDQKALKKFLAKMEKDLKSASGVTVWDHEVLLNAVSLFGSPLAPTLDVPVKKVLGRMSELSLAPTLSLEQVAVRRKSS
jgi:hypothetical protein